MLWSLLKVVIFIAIVGLLAIGAGQLLNADGSIRVAFADMEITLGPLGAAIAAVLAVLAVWLGLKLLGLLVAFIRFLSGDETALTRHFARNREKKGLKALSDAMLAVAAGEGREAQAKAERAEHYLGRPDVTGLLLAQGAEIAGDKKKAEEVYKQLVQDERTRFVGVRGLLKHQMEQDNTETALALAKEAFALKPKHGETQDTLLKLQAATKDWDGARKTLAAKAKQGALPRDVAKRRDAVLALSGARELLDESLTPEVREGAIEANRLSPDLIPAAVLAARGYIKNNQERYATRVLKKAWEAQPHPDLAAAFAEIQPEESAAQRVRRFTTLTRIHPDHPETRMLLAELHIANEDFPAARRALGDLATSHPTARSVTIMAAVERGEGSDDAIVRGWLTKAATVPRGPQWVCENCHTVHGEWAAVCDNCSAFDTLAWKEPKEGTVAMPAGTAMLPLIVGQLESQPVAEESTAPSEVADDAVEVTATEVTSALEPTGPVSVEQPVEHKKGHQKPDAENAADGEIIVAADNS
ncbi:heme biosynthesis protein HemY [Palleronia caenipelagi]|uniref:Heme biosynthesis protein HemY n=1 Tax=Palleronia caenipelagi TaxID=2489174 RepID=A0A547Q859_9RHOB|nr:heme biosynthesis HemY N-terminal domain-containing protein [Palleronia caenipelagi]TRD22551.1 heme biosynthesis protein HemY [Palleronia caenipelagi]